MKLTGLGSPRPQPTRPAMPLSGQQFTLRGRPAPSPGHICENNSAADWIAVLALVFEVFWSSFQPPQVVMVPAAQSCDWSELQMVSMAIERICAERTSGLGNELTATLLGNEPPLPGEGGGSEGMEACREKRGRGDGGLQREGGARGWRPAEILPARDRRSSPALLPTLGAQLPNRKCCRAGSHRGCQLQISGCTK